MELRRNKSRIMSSIQKEMMSEMKCFDLRYHRGSYLPLKYLLYLIQCFSKSITKSSFHSVKILALISNYVTSITCLQFEEMLKTLSSVSEPL